MPVYIGKGGDWSGVTAASLTDRQTTEYSATQLVSSIKFNLSHPISLRPKLLPECFNRSIPSEEPYAKP